MFLISLKRQTSYAILNGALTLVSKTWASSGTILKMTHGSLSSPYLNGKTIPPANLAFVSKH